jgi:hypothetical protein
MKLAVLTTRRCLTVAARASPPSHCCALGLPQPLGKKKRPRLFVQAHEYRDLAIPLYCLAKGVFVHCQLSLRVDIFQTRKVYYAPTLHQVQDERRSGTLEVTMPLLRGSHILPLRSGANQCRSGSLRRAVFFLVHPNQIIRGTA